MTKIANCKSRFERCCHCNRWRDQLSVKSRFCSSGFGSPPRIAASPLYISFVRYASCTPSSAIILQRSRPARFITRARKLKIFTYGPLSIGVTDTSMTMSSKMNLRHHDENLRDRLFPERVVRERVSAEADVELEATVMYSPVSSLC